MRISTFLFSIAALVALAGVFLMYTRPAFMVMLAEQLWACF